MITTHIDLVGHASLIRLHLLSHGMLQREEQPRHVPDLRRGKPLPKMTIRQTLTTLRIRQLLLLIPLLLP